MRPRKVKEERSRLQLGDLVVPVRLITETRRDVRASITAKAFIIRLPYGISDRDRTHGVRKMTD